MEFYNKIYYKYAGIRGFITLYKDALRYRYMIQEKALEKFKILCFWEKYGLEATIDAFSVKRRTLFDWKRRFREGGNRPESLNEKKRTPKEKRRRLWPEPIVAEIKRLRWEHPNLGKDKLEPLLEKFCLTRGLLPPKSSTIGRLIKDLGGLRVFPQKISPATGKIIPLKRRKVLRKPKGFKPKYPGHLVALDTVERIVFGSRRYIITFEDIYTRFGFAWATRSHASFAAKEFFDYCRRTFPFSFAFILTDNGSEFMKHFAKELERLHFVHYHTYPKTPQQNSHLERFNRTLQEEFVDHHANLLLNVDLFNRKLIDWLVWYNTERPHWAFQNKFSPIQFILSLQPANLSQECNFRWTYTGA